MCLYVYDREKEFGAKVIYFAKLFIYYLLSNLIYFQDVTPVFCSLAIQKMK